MLTICLVSELITFSRKNIVKIFTICLNKSFLVHIVFETSESTCYKKRVLFKK